MPTLTIHEPERPATTLRLTRPVIRIGRGSDERHPNDVALVDSTVSRRHAAILQQGGQWLLRNFGANGSFIDEAPVTEDRILAGTVRLRFGARSQVLFEETEGPSAIEPHRVEASRAPKAVSTGGHQLRQEIHDRLLERMQLSRKKLEQLKPELLEQEAREKLAEIIDELSDRIPVGTDVKALTQEMFDHALGLGPLEAFLADDSITEIMVNGRDQIYVERNGKIETSGSRFLSEDQILAVIRRIVAPLGRRIDEASPMVDARLPDGSRVNAVIRPLALCGPTITIRKFARERLTIPDLVAFGSLIPEMADFFELAVRSRRNIVISGGTGSGKTTLLNVLADAIPDEERIVSVEDAAELQLPQEHCVPLEHRPPNAEGTGEVTIRDLVRNCLRMRPDRIIVGEVRGGEALDMLNAMNTGHDGSLTTAHANSPRDVLARLSTMVLMSGMDLPLRAIREQIAAAVDLIIQVQRLKDGSRKVTQITEVTGMEGDVITLGDLFEFRQTGLGGQGEVLGFHTATGHVPRFVEDLRERGHAIDRNIFLPREATS